MSIVQQQTTFSLNVSKLIAHIYEQGYAVTFGDAYRSQEQANIDAAKGIGIKNSLHCQRLAIDLNLFKDDIYITDPASYKQFATYWESLNSANRSGINFPRGDANHFQMNP